MTFLEHLYKLNRSYNFLMVDMVTLYKEEIICVFLAHRTCIFVLTIALTLTLIFSQGLTLTFGLAHKTYICSS